MSTVYVLVNFIAVEALVIWLGRYYGIPVWKRAVATLLMSAAGFGGGKLMYFIENGNWGGRSYFGLVLFCPVLFILIALALKIPQKDLLDLAAPCEGATLIVMKVACVIEGCCKGIVLRVAEDGSYIRFPSQIVECINGVLLTAAFTLMIVKAKRRGELMWWYMIFYGITRYCLNLFRESDAFFFFMPIGNLWSLVSILLGLTALAFTRMLSSERGKREALL